MKAPELPALTGIRFFAASFVFFAHMNTLPGKTWFVPKLASTYNLGGFGVEIFFVLSGFILTYNYAALFGNGVNVGNYIRFIWDRLAKIYPLYLLTLLLAIPIELAGHRDWSWEALFLQLTLLQCILPVNHLSAADHFNVPAWSISCEMFFYLLTPAMIWLGLSFKRPTPVLIFGWLTAIVLTVATGIWAIHFATWPGRFAPAQTPEFIVGVVTAICFLKNPAPKNSVIQLCIISGCALLIPAIFLRDSVPLFQLGFLNAPGAALLIYGLAYGRGWLAQFLSHRWVELLGMSSFAFYLIHDLIIRIFKGAFEHYHVSINNSFSAITMTATLFIMTQIISIIVFKKVESPAQKYLRGLARRKTTAETIHASPAG
jgi:peptidoglycan/LPS O-acetylase OafA/YrhL